MRHSTTIWAAALALASISGPLLATAEAMPAPQKTDSKPRYYFPRHVKRQIVTNSTAPASSTVSSTTTSDLPESPELRTRQNSGSIADDLSSFFESLANSPSPSSSTATSTVTEIHIPLGTGVSSSVSSESSTVSLYTPPPPIPLDSFLNPTDSGSSTATSDSAEAKITSDVASSGGLPSSIVVPTSVPDVAPTGGLPSSIVVPTSVPDVAPTGGLPSSIVVPISVPDVASTGGLPSSIVIPTSAPDVASTGDIPSIIVLPTSVPDIASKVLPTSAKSLADVPLLKTESSDTPTPTTDSGSESTGGLPLSIVIPTSLDLLPSSIPDVIGSTGILPPLIVTPTTTANAGTTADAVSEPTGIIVGLTTALGITDLPTSIQLPLSTDLPIPTDSDITASPEATPTSLNPLASLLSSVVSGVDSVLVPSDTPSGILPSDGATPTGTDSGPVTTTPPDPLASLLSSVVSDLSSVAGSIVDPIVTGVSSVVSGLTSDVATLVPTSVPGLSSYLSSAIGETGVPPVSSILSGVGTGVSSPLPTPTASVDIPLTTDLSSVISSAVSDAPSYPGTAPTAPVTTSDVISSQPGPTSVPSGVFPPTVSSGATTAVVGTSVPSSLPESAPPTTTNATTPVIPVPVSSATEPSYVATPATSAGELPKFTLPPQTIVPTGTDSATAFVVPTSIAMEPTTAGAPTAKMSGMPSGMPQIIRPPDGIIKPQPPNTTLCEFGFKWPLNFNFVLTSQDASNQLFYYIPKAVAYAVGIPEDQVVMSTLKPYDTTRSLGFVTTLALFYLPEDRFDVLLPQMNNPPDLLWNNPNSTVNALTSLINTGIPLRAGPLPVDGSPTQSGSPSSTATGGYGDDGPMGKGESQPVKATSVYIGLGAVAGAAAYGAAMFFVARRYRNKRVSHQRASSVPSASHRNSASPMGPAWMAGGRGAGRSTPGGRDSRGSGSSNGRSVRTQQISAPVMAENSLGWN